MALLFRSLKRFAIFFLFLTATLLVLRMLVGTNGVGTTHIVPEDILALQAIDTILLILSLTGAVVVVVFMYLLVFWIVRWAITSLLRAPSVAETQPLNRLFGLVAVAAFFGTLLVDAFAALRWLVRNLFSNFPYDLTEAFRSGMTCIERNAPYSGEVLDSSCVSSFFFDAARTISNAAQTLFSGAGVGVLNPVMIVGALALFLIVSIATSRVRSDLAPKEQFWLAYGCVAFFATYLTLSAILAVPLLDEDADETPRPASELRTNLEPMLPVVQEESEASGQDEAVTLSEVVEEDSIKLPLGASEAETAAVLSSLEFMRRDARSFEAWLEEASQDSSDLRSTSLRTLRNQLDAAVLTYESDIGVRRGKREASRHFVDLRNWFQDTVNEATRISAECESNVNAAERRYADTVMEMRTVFGAGHDGTVDGALRLATSASQRLNEQLSLIGTSLREADLVCEATATSSVAPPSRSDYGSFLGVVGTAASWLLSTESMEVALLTGLIGFGLLGSLVAQFVKNGGTEEFNVAQIATVVFSGFCAAIVVYVTAYGGLAIASMSGSDPNPYVVFGACLVGAVYSGEIWERAKKWMITDDPKG